MIRNLKALGFALAAVLAMVSGGASSASAQTIGKITSDGPVTQEATPTGTNAITAFGGKLECPKAIYTGHAYKSTPHQLLESGATTATITPHFGQCTGLGFPMTVDMNGCDFVFHFTETNGTHSYAITETLECSGGNHVTITIFSSHTKHTLNEPFCHITITEPANGYTGLSAVDKTDGTIGMSGTTTGIVGHRKSPTGSILCPEETTNTASFHIDLLGVGKNSGGGATALSMSH